MIQKEKNQLALQVLTTIFSTESMEIESRNYFQQVNTKYVPPHTTKDIHIRTTLHMKNNLISSNIQESDFLLILVSK